MQEQAFLKLECRILFSVRCLLKTMKVTMIHYDKSNYDIHCCNFCYLKQSVILC